MEILTKQSAPDLACDSNLNPIANQIKFKICPQITLLIQSDFIHGLGAQQFPCSVTVHAGTALESKLLESMASHLAVPPEKKIMKRVKVC